MCISLCTTAVHNTAQNSSDIFPLCTTAVYNTAQNSSDIFPLILQTDIITQMLSTGGER